MLSYASVSRTKQEKRCLSSELWQFTSRFVRKSFGLLVTFQWIMWMLKTPATPKDYHLEIYKIDKLVTRLHLMLAKVVILTFVVRGIARVWCAWSFGWWL